MTRSSAWRTQPRTVGTWLTAESCCAFLRAPMKRTYQPHNTRRARKYGFRARMASVGGRKIINNRRAKGRARLATKIYEK